MFAPAEWENDVPENAADFVVVHKGMNESSLKKKTEKISSKKIKKRRNKTRLITTHSIHNTESQPTQITMKMDTSKRPYPTEETKSSPEVDERPRKHKKLKGTSNISMEDDLDETIIANKKKEMYSSMKSKELEQTLFSKNAVPKGNLDETIIANKKKEMYSSTRTNNLEQTQLSNNTVPKGNLHENTNEMYSSVKPKKFEKTLLSKNTGNLDQTIFTKTNKKKKMNSSVKSKKLEKILLSKNTVSKSNLDQTKISKTNKKKEMYSSVKSKKLQKTLLNKNTVPKGNLHETIIANNKKEKYSSVKSNELEETLFSKNAVPKDNLDETIIANKKKEMYSSTRTNNLEQTQLSNNTVPKGNLHENTNEMYSSVKPKKFEKTLLSKNTVSKSNLDQTKISNTNKKKEMYSSVKSKKLQKTLLNKNAVPKDNLDETIIANNKKEKYSSVKSNELEETLLSNKNTVPTFKVQSDGVQKDRNKDKIKNILQTHLVRSSIKGNGALLHQRMTETLKSAQFRYLNEKLYLSEGKDAKDMFKADPTSFKIYHTGYKQQVKKWPMNPLEIIIKNISKMPKETKVADLGCGEGILAERVPQKVRSFDLVSMADGVEECDMAHTPLLTGEMDVAVYCLSLMGTNLREYFIEANRILKIGGIMKIAEVESRFKNMNEFIKGVERYGFKMIHVNDSHKVFYFIDFKKMNDLGAKKNNLPHITLDPCLYMKR